MYADDGNGAFLVVGFSCIVYNLNNHPRHPCSTSTGSGVEDPVLK